MGYRIRKFYKHLNDRQIDKLFNTIKANGMADSLLKDSNVSFDWHSSGLLKILGTVAVSKVIQAVKIPFRLRDRG